MRRRESFLLVLAVWVASGLSMPVSAATTEGDTVLIGLNMPLSGSYSQQGEDELKAYKLAIKMLNEKGGILGKKVVYSVKDTKTDAAVARENAKELLKEGAVMLTGGSSSAEAVAQSEECEKAKVVFMAGLTHANETTGKDAHRRCFRWYHNGHQSAKALASILDEKYGKDATYAYIYADYIWGLSVLNSMKNVLEASGAKTVLEVATPLGKKSYVADLLQAKKTAPTVLVVVQFGNDMVNCLKQVKQLKLGEQMAVVVPLMEEHMAHSVGPEVMQGILTSMCWYHSLADKYPGSKAFVEAFEKEYSKKPGNAAATAWVDIFQYADAVERAKSFDNVAVIKALEGHKFTLLLGEEYWRDWDHQGIHPTYLAIGKTPAESKNEWDLFTIIGERSGDELARTRAENPVNLEPLE